MTRAAACGVVVASVPWAEPGQPVHTRFRIGTRVADERREPEDRKRVFRTSRGAPPEDAAHRVAERLKASMPSPFGGLTSIGVDETGYRKGHTCITVVVDHERHRAIWAHDRVRQGRVRPVLPNVDARTARLHQGRRRGRGPVDRLMRA